MFQTILQRVGDSLLYILVDTHSVPDCQAHVATVKIHDSYSPVQRKCDGFVMHCFASKYTLL